jgi:hypothetical protein
MMMTAMMPGTPRRDVRRLEVEANDAAGNVHTGLALQAEGLQCKGVCRAANQQITATADDERHVAANTTVVAGEVAAADTLGRSMHRPGEARFRGYAKVHTKPGYMRKIRLRATAVGVKNALKGGRGSDNHTDVLTAVAFKNADLNALLLSLSGSERRNERRNGGANYFSKTHGI